jgi:hypothetical protein
MIKTNYSVNNGECLQLPGQYQSLQEARQFYLSLYKYPVDLDNSMGLNWALFINNAQSEHTDVLNSLMEILLRNLSRFSSGYNDTLENVICNITVALPEGKVVGVHRNPNRYPSQKTYGQTPYSYNKMIYTLDQLESAAYIHQAPGYYNHLTCEGKITRIWPGLKFFEALDKAREECSVKNPSLLLENAIQRNPDVNPIILRNSKSYMIRYSPSPELQSGKKLLYEYNELLASSTVSCIRYSELSRGRFGAVEYKLLYQPADDDRSCYLDISSQGPADIMLPGEMIQHDPYEIQLNDAYNIDQDIACTGDWNDTIACRSKRIPESKGIGSISGGYIYKY